MIKSIDKLNNNKINNLEANLIYLELLHELKSKKIETQSSRSAKNFQEKEKRNEECKHMAKSFTKNISMMT